MSKDFSNEFFKGSSSSQNFEQLQKSMDRMSKALEESNKLKASTKRDTVNNLSQPQKILEQAKAVGGGVDNLIQGNVNWMSIARTIGNAIAGSIREALKDINKHAESMTEAKLGDPEKQITRIAELRARLGDPMSNQEIHQMRREMAAPNVRADLARKQVQSEFSGLGVMGRLSENMFDTNIPREIERVKQRMGNWYSKWDTYNADYHDKYAQSPIITSQGVSGSSVMGE